MVSTGSGEQCNAPVLRKREAQNTNLSTSLVPRNLLTFDRRQVDPGGVLSRGSGNGGILGAKLSKTFPFPRDDSDIVILTNAI